MRGSCPVDTGRLVLLSRKMLRGSGVPDGMGRRSLVSCQGSGGRTYRLNLVLVEPRNHADDDPRERSPKVDDLVYHEAHDARRKGVVLHPEIPSLRVQPVLASEERWAV